MIIRKSFFFLLPIIRKFATIDIYYYYYLVIDLKKEKEKILFGH